MEKSKEEKFAPARVTLKKPISEVSEDTPRVKQFLGRGLVLRLTSILGHQADKARIRDLIDWMLEENLITPALAQSEAFNDEFMYHLILTRF